MTPFMTIIWLVVCCIFFITHIPPSIWDARRHGRHLQAFNNTGLESTQRTAINVRTFPENMRKIPVIRASVQVRRNASKDSKLPRRHDSTAVSNLVCGKDYAAELLRRPWGPCLQPFPQLMLHGKRKAAGKGGFDIGPSCPIKWFTAAEACDLFGRLGHVAFLGDSLIRQLLVGVATVLSGNFRTGGINAFTPVDYYAYCQCEHQWQCYKHPVDGRFRSHASAPQFTVCPLWTRDHISWQSDLTSLQRTRPINDALVIIDDASALHSSLEWSKLENKMHASLKVARRLGGDMIPMTVHWPGPNKPVQFRKSQGPEVLEQYHQALRNWSKSQDVWVFESYQFTKEEWSRDGVHYDDLNIALSQLLMNHLQRMLEAGKLRSVPEANPADPATYRLGKPEDKNIAVYRGPHPPRR